MTAAAAINQVFSSSQDSRICFVEEREGKQDDVFLLDVFCVH